MCEHRSVLQMRCSHRKHDAHLHEEEYNLPWDVAGDAVHIHVSLAGDHVHQLNEVDLAVGLAICQRDIHFLILLYPRIEIPDRLHITRFVSQLTVRIPDVAATTAATSAATSLQHRTEHSQSLQNHARYVMKHKGNDLASHLGVLHILIVWAVLELQLNILVKCIFIIADAFDEHVLHLVVELVDQELPPLLCRVGGIENSNLVVITCTPWPYLHHDFGVLTGTWLEVT